jgi:hypothetical protein
LGPNKLSHSSADNGVVYVAYGQKAKQEAMESIKSLKQHNSLPVTVIDESKFNGGDFMTDSQRARWGKLNIPELVDYDRVLYADADTRFGADITPGFDILDEWDMAIVPSKNQGSALFAHIPNAVEKETTLTEIGNPWPLQMQCGLMFIHRERCAGFFAEWKKSWLEYKDQDQAAFLRALHREPIRVWILGKPWNSDNGEIVSHLFGRCR